MICDGLIPHRTMKEENLRNKLYKVWGVGVQVVVA